MPWYIISWKGEGDKIWYMQHSMVKRRLEFVTTQWAQTLQPCVDEIIRIDTNNDYECIAKVMQPYVLMKE